MKKYKLLSRVFAAKILLFIVSSSVLASEALTIGVQSKDLGTLDPAIAYEWSNLEVVPSINSGLLGWNVSANHPVLDLAKSMEISDDGLRIRFELRDGIVFHNGRAITADDFVYSYERIVHPDTKSPYRSFLANIEGFTAFSDGTSDRLKGVRAISALVFELRLSKPDAALLTVLSQWIGSVVPREAVEQEGFSHHPVGAGAYRLISRDNDKLVLKKFQRHPLATEAQPDEINVILGLSDAAFLQRVRRGEIDYVSIYQPSERLLHLSTTANYAPYLQMVESSSTVFLSLNSRNGPLKDKQLRRAINMAIDKNALQHHVFAYTGTVTGHILPPSLRFMSKFDASLSYDPATAKSLIEKASVDPLQMLVLDQALSKKAAQMIVNDLLKVGIDCRMVIVNESDFVRRVKDQDIDMIYSDGMAWMADYPDPSNFYFPLFSPEAHGDGYNWGGFTDTDVHNRAVEINTWIGPKNTEKRQLAWEELLHDIQVESIPWVPIYHRKIMYLYSPKKKGVSEFLKSDYPSLNFGNFGRERFEPAQ